MIGHAVSGNNIRQVGVVVDFAEHRPAVAGPCYQVQWASGQLEWIVVEYPKSLDHEIAALEARLAQVQAAKSRALRAVGR
jgi:hypothetical protein